MYGISVDRLLRFYARIYTTLCQDLAYMENLFGQSIEGGENIEFEVVDVFVDCHWYRSSHFDRLECNLTDEAN